MKLVTVWRGSALALAAATLLLPTRADAQISDPVLDHQHDAAVAVAYAGTPGALEEAILRHGMVVHQRMHHDERRFECLKSHANLMYYSGRLDGARDYMVAAAEQAAWEGHDYDAAMTYIDAAILAREAGDVGAAVRLAAEASALGQSPRLDAAQRQRIVDRLGQ